VAKGFEIIMRNYRHKHSEIDLIVKKNNWLIFVEVKMRSSDAYGYPEDFVDYKKAKNIVSGAESIPISKIGKAMFVLILFQSGSNTEKER